MTIDMPVPTKVGESYTAQNDVVYICTNLNPVVWSASGGSSPGPSPTPGGASVNVGVNPPDAPNIGDLWYNTNDGILYVWYVDQTQVDDLGEGQWVDVRPGNEG